MAEHHPEIIIVKRKGGHGGGHHGGAWKIAFADFMTAMMAFFLVLWIINASDKDTKTVIARYFNPVKLENPSRAKKGLHGATAPPTESQDTKADKTGTSSEPSKDAKTPPKPDDKNKQKPEKEKPEKPEKSKSPPKTSNPSPEVDPSVADAQMFEAPFQALDRIVNGKGMTAPGASPEIGSADAQHEAGALSVDSYRDPFKPMGPGSPDDPVSLEAEKSPGVEGKEGPSIERKKTGAEKVAPDTPGDGPEGEQSPARDAGPNKADGAGKTDLTGKADGVGKTELSGKAEGAGRAEAASKLMKDLTQKLGPAAKSGAGPSIEVRATEDGLLISLTDKLNFNMFAVGSAEPRAELVRAMETIAQSLKGKPGQIVLRGHTDARAYKGGGYDNWRLSSARAQMAYYMLVRGGLPESRVGRVEGYADRALRDPAHPLAAENRRLEILLREPRP